MPPECLNGKGSNLLSEVWSIGMILEEAAIGRYPIPDLTKTEVAIVRKKIELISRGEWKQLTDVQQKWCKACRKRTQAIPLLELMVQVSTPPTVPVDLFGDDFRDIMSRCLQVDRSDRASVDELLSHAFVRRLNHQRGESQAGFSDFVTVASKQ
ncbi:mitogen-activated protein kinase kinase MKK4 [Aphelenchoides avenae]|nr:mitogen-activated protein kinase kinase MKK4 [Aphelenchus avenae]